MVKAGLLYVETLSGVQDNLGDSQGIRPGRNDAVNRSVSFSPF